MKFSLMVFVVLLSAGAAYAAGMGSGSGRSYVDGVGNMRGYAPENKMGKDVAPSDDAAGDDQSEDDKPEADGETNTDQQ